MGNVIYTKFGIEKSWHDIEAQHAQMAADVLPSVSLESREQIAAELTAMVREMTGNPDRQIKPADESLHLDIPEISRERCTAIAQQIQAYVVRAIEHAIQQQANITITHCVNAAESRVWLALRIAAGEAAASR